MYFRGLRGGRGAAARVFWRFSFTVAFCTLAGVVPFCFAPSSIKGWGGWESSGMTSRNATHSLNVLSRVVHGVVSFPSYHGLTAIIFIYRYLTSYKRTRDSRALPFTL